MNTKELQKAIRDNPFFLAPMAGITDMPFRSFMKEMGCGLITTELVSAKSLEAGNEMSKRLMAFTEDQRPLGVQIFGEDLQTLHAGSQIVEQAGADFVDLNFGCPVQKIVKKGAGSAVLKDLVFLRKILKTVRKAVSLPVSIKVRTGWDSHSRNTPEVAQMAHDEGMAWITVHGRTRKEAYSGQADWAYIQEVKKQSPLPVIGNGDLKTPEQVLRLKKESACDGMMIGRGALKNPWIFQEIQERSRQSKALSFSLAKTLSQKQNIQGEGESPDRKTDIAFKGDSRGHKTQKTYMEVLDRLQSYLENFYDERIFLLQYKKFATWYSSGYPDSACFRKEVFQSRDRQEVMDRVASYFSRIDRQVREDQAYDPSLMQGHG